MNTIFHLLDWQRLKIWQQVWMPRMWRKWHSPILTVGTRTSPSIQERTLVNLTKPCTHCWPSKILLLGSTCDLTWRYTSIKTKIYTQTVTHYCNHKDHLDAHTRKWINRSGCIHTEEYHTAAKRNKEELPKVTWVVSSIHCQRKTKKKQRVFVVWYTLCKKKKKQMWENTHRSACFVRKQTKDFTRKETDYSWGQGRWGTGRGRRSEGGIDISEYTFSNNFWLLRTTVMFHILKIQTNN